ncbi:MAG: hypothetical protein ABH828_04650 [archaeon]
MVSGYLSGLFVIVNTLLSIYILTYAFIFLSRTKHYPDRRPWEFLFAGAFFFMFSQIVGLITVYGVHSVFGIGTENLKVISEFIYATLILIAFITQSHLILMSDMILITSKVKRRKEKKKPKFEMDDDIPLPNK